MPIGDRRKQFEWNVTYPGADGKLGTADDFTIRGQLHVPVNKPTVVMLDIGGRHSLVLRPSFRIKQDAVPGMHIRVWFQPTKAGEYELGCAELCGLGHYRMRADRDRPHAGRLRPVGWPTDPPGRSTLKASTMATTATGSYCVSYDTAHAHVDDRSFIRKYIFSTDHKIIGIQFLIMSLMFLLAWRNAGDGDALAAGVSRASRCRRVRCSRIRTRPAASCFPSSTTRW